MQLEYLRSKMGRLPDRGIYLLLIHIPKRMRINIGALGEIEFYEGYYVYVGSAQRNLKRRIERHMRKEKKLKWHIDYLLTQATLEDFEVYPLGKEYEDNIAYALLKRYPGVKGFGSSDSRVGSHLFFIGGRDQWCKVLNIARN